MRERIGRGRRLVGLAVAAGALLTPGAASAAIDDVFGGDVTCTVRSDGARFCGSDSPRSTTKTFDGVPLDVNVAFPPQPAGGQDGNYPLVMLFHGYGGGKIGLGQMQQFLDRGYAAFSMTDRGFRESCGSAASRAADPAGCADGYVRLLDTRYEVRDAQVLAGRLVDEGLADPQRLAATGGSYGGGLTMALAALKNRTMLEDGTLVGWTSPAGTPIRLAAAAASVPWTDLAYSLVPNGGTLDYLAGAPYEGRIGVMKESLVNGLYLSGLLAPGFYAPAGSDPSADLTGWFELLGDGEPYGAEAGAAIAEITSHHSSYYIDDSTKPAPLLISSGFTDDLFPVDEATRFYNRTRSTHSRADLAMFFGDFGHPRAQNKDDVIDLLESRQNAWLDHYVLGAGPEPNSNVTAMTQTCPNTAASGGPYRAKTWAKLAPGEIRLQADGERTIAADSSTGGSFDPVSGGGACETADGAEIPGSATYRLDPAPGNGYTLLGAATVIAKFTVPGGDTSQVAARLVDVAPDGQETLVNRGLWRPALGGPTKQSFQLHPNGWHFKAGHVPKLELIAKDAGGGALNSYGRPSNDQQPVTVKRLQLRLPVLELPGSRGGLVGTPAPKLVPDGHELASDFEALPDRGAKLQGKLAIRGKRLRGKLTCPGTWKACHDGSIEITASKGGGFAVAAGDFELRGGKSKYVKMKPTRKARKQLAKRGKLKVRVEVRSSERVNAWQKRTKLVAKR
jgi:dienelactone hydrolase